MYKSKVVLFCLEAIVSNVQRLLLILCWGWVEWRINIGSALEIMWYHVGIYWSSTWPPACSACMQSIESLSLTLSLCFYSSHFIWWVQLTLSRPVCIYLNSNMMFIKILLFRLFFLKEAKPTICLCGRNFFT